VTQGVAQSNGHFTRRLDLLTFCEKVIPGAGSFEIQILHDLLVGDGPDEGSSRREDHRLSLELRDGFVPLGDVIGPRLVGKICDVASRTYLLQSHGIAVAGPDEEDVGSGPGSKLRAQRSLKLVRIGIRQADFGAGILVLEGVYEDLDGLRVDARCGNPQRSASSTTGALLTTADEPAARRERPCEGRHTGARTDEAQELLPVELPTRKLLLTTALAVVLSHEIAPYPQTSNSFSRPHFTQYRAAPPCALPPNPHHVHNHSSTRLFSGRPADPAYFSYCLHSHPQILQSLHVRLARIGDHHQGHLGDVRYHAQPLPLVLGHPRQNSPTVSDTSERR
jgi:hypothetical protein